ncbi:MAG: hypothetical protein ABEN55_03735 [Bradymonadaceae bacterium]
MNQDDISDLPISLDTLDDYVDHYDDVEIVEGAGYSELRFHFTRVRYQRPRSSKYGDSVRKAKEVYYWIRFYDDGSIEWSHGQGAEGTPFDAIDEDIEESMRSGRIYTKFIRIPINT